MPSIARVKTLGINKKILFQHFKHQGLCHSTFSKEKILNQVISQHMQEEEMTISDPDV